MGKRKASLYALVLGGQYQEIAVSIINLEDQISIRTQKKKKALKGPKKAWITEVSVKLC